MKTIGHAVPFLLALFLFAGCSPVLMKQPFPAASCVDKDKLEGAWQAGTSIFLVKFAKDGSGQLAIPEWKDERFRLIKGEIMTAPGRANPYICIRAEDNGGKMQDAWSLAQYHFSSDNDLVLWWAELDPFEVAVTNKSLEGQAVTGGGDGKLLLTSDPTKVIKFLDETPASLFSYANPVILRRINTGDK